MLISTSGRAGVGKDTVGKIIQYLTSWSNNNFTNLPPRSFEEWFKSYEVRKINKALPEFDWEIKKWADKLKDMTCILLGCSREQLEDREWKEQELGEEWNLHYLSYGNVTTDPKGSLSDSIKHEKALEKDWGVKYTRSTKALSPRLVMQLLGTDCVRNLIHPDAWVLGLMAEYKMDSEIPGFDKRGPKGVCGIDENGNSLGKEDWGYTLPDWIITDTRFPNELQAVKDRGGVTIRVERNVERMCWYGDDWVTETEFNLLWYNDTGHYPSQDFVTKLLKSNHASETALDDAEFDYYIDNNGTVPELIERVREILVKEKLI